jgi:hypothetical protein
MSIDIHRNPEGLAMKPILLIAAIAAGVAAEVRLVPEGDPEL